MLANKSKIQASKQAPWRREAQTIALILGAIAIFGLISGLYLDVTARAATAGRNVQSLRQDRENLEQTIEDNQSNLAYLRSIQVMQRRAEDLGFSTISPSTVLYVNVPSYLGRFDAQLAPAPGDNFLGGQRMPEEYSQSLFDWAVGIFSILGDY